MRHRCNILGRREVITQEEVKTPDIKQERDYQNKTGNDKTNIKH